MANIRCLYKCVFKARVHLLPSASSGAHLGPGGKKEGRSVRRSIQGMANRTLAGYCTALKAKDHHDLRDVTTLLSGCAKYLWGTARARVIRIEVLVVLSAISLLFMATFGPLRRRTRNSFVQNGVMIAYTLSSSLISYTLGSMSTSSVKSSM